MSVSANNADIVTVPALVAFGDEVSISGAKWSIGANEQDTNLIVRRLAERPGGMRNAHGCMKAGIRVHPATFSLLIMGNRRAKNSC